MYESKNDTFMVTDCHQISSCSYAHLTVIIMLN